MNMIDHLGLMIRMPNLFAIFGGDSLSLRTGFEAPVYGSAGQGEGKYNMFDSFASQIITNDLEFSMLGVYKPFCQYLCMICQLPSGLSSV
jgi:hypothetical protein